MRRIHRFTLVILVLILFLMPLIMVFNQNQIMHGKNSEFELSRKVANITISNDGELAANASSGHGNWTHPYIIENYTFNMAGYSTFAILISGTSAYFIIKNCTFYNGPIPYAAIRFESVTNGLIYNNTFTSCFNSIYFYQSSNCNATENTCHLGTTGTAITLYQSNNIKVINNTLTNNSRGVMIWGSSSNTVTNNTILNSLDSGIAFENPTGSSTNNLILNNTCSFGNNYGIQLIGSSTNNNDIINNTCNNNGYYLFTTSGIGIYLNGANFNDVINNTAINNEDYGIQLSSASNNTIQFNNMLENNEGIYLQSSSDNNTLSNNSILNNEANGIHLTDADFNVIGNNTLFNHSGSNDVGIYLENSNNNTIITNNISENYLGIELYPECDNNTITNNSLIKNIYIALYLGESDDNLISYNSFIENYGDTYQYSCSGNVFIGNTYIPPSPVLYSFSPNPDDDGNIYIDWGSVAGGSRYFVYRNTSVINFADEDLIIYVDTVPFTSYWDYSTTNDTTYYYAIVAERSGFNSSLSNCESVTVMFFAPQDPPVLEEITPDPDPDGSILLNWSSVENATRYYVYNDTTEISTVSGMEPLLTTTSTNYTHVIPYNTTYHYVIVAGNDYGNSSISNCENVTTLLQAPQDAPNLEAFDPNPNYFRNINVNWSAVQNATQYHVFRNTSNINSPDEQLRIATVTDTNYTDDITQNGTYYYAVVAANAFGNSSLSNCESVLVQVTPNTTILEEITPGPDTDGIIELNWSDVINADNYYIYRNTSSISSISGMTPIDTVTTSNYTDYLFQNLEYYYVIVAGNAFANSTISNCENVTVQLPLNATTVDEISPNPSTTGTIQLNWSAVTYADFYLIYRSNSNITTIIGLTQLDNVTSTNYTDNITINGIYYYIVIAGNSLGNSSLSNCVNVTVQFPNDPPPQNPPIPGFEWVYVILGLFFIVSIVYLVKQKRHNFHIKLE